MNYAYTIIIQWSQEDQCYVVSLPEDLPVPITFKGDSPCWRFEQKSSVSEA